MHWRKNEIRHSKLYFPASQQDCFAVTIESIYISEYGNESKNIRKSSHLTDGDPLITETMYGTPPPSRVIFRRLDPHLQILYISNMFAFQRRFLSKYSRFAYRSGVKKQCNKLLLGNALSVLTRWGYLLKILVYLKRPRRRFKGFKFQTLDWSIQITIVYAVNPSYLALLANQ